MDRLHDSRKKPKKTSSARPGPAKKSIHFDTRAASLLLCPNNGEEPVDLGPQALLHLGVAMGAKKRQANRVVFVEIGLLGARNMLEKTLQTSRKHLYRIK